MEQDPSQVSPAEPASTTGRGLLWLKVLRAILLGPIVIVGWIAFLSWVGLVLMEQTGLLNSLVETEVERRLGPVTDDFRIRSTHVDWLQRTVRLGGISSGPGGRDIYIDELSLVFGWKGERGPGLERVELDGGSLRISRALMNGIQGLMNSREPVEPSAPLPTIVVEGLLVEGETPGWGDLQAGHLDACLRPEDGGVRRLAGRLLPPGSSPGDPSGEIFLSGELDREGVLFMRAAARALHLSTDHLPAGTPLEELRSFEAEAVLDLEATGRFDARRSLYPTLKTRLTLDSGRFRVPAIAEPTRQHFEALRVEMQAEFRPEGSQALWDLDAWHGSGHLGTEWAGEPADVWWQVGRDATPGFLAEAWTEVPRIHADAGLEGLTDAPLWKEILAQYRPVGTAGAAFGMRLPATWKATDGLGRALERCLSVRGSGEISVAYHGLRDKRTGQRNRGFPMRVHGIEGEFLYGFHPDNTLPEQMGFVNLRGEAGGGDVQVEGFVHARPRWFLAPGAPLWMSEWEFYLRATGQGIDLGEELQGGLQGLSGVVPEREVWERYDPRSGKADFDVRLWHDTSAPGLATHVGLDLEQARLAWSGFPVELSETDARVDVWVDGHPASAGTAAWAAAVDATGRAEASREPIEVRVRARGEPVPPELARIGSGPGRSGKPPRGDVSTTLVRARDVNVRNPALREVLGRQYPVAIEVLEETGAAGFADLRLEYVKPLDRPEVRTVCEVDAGEGGLSVRPESFPMPTRDLQGRTVLVFEGQGGQEDVAADVRIGPLLGAWDSPEGTTPLAAQGHFPRGGPGRLELQGAGLSTGNPRLLESVQSSLRSSGGDASVDLAEFGFEGRLDASTIVALGDAEEQVLQLHGHLRSGVLGEPSRPILHDLRGALRLDDGRLRSDRLRAVLGTTPVELRDFHLETGEGTTLVRTSISAQGMPLDFDHLSSFLDEETLSTLLDELRWSGKIDIESGRLDVKLVEGETPVLRFRGKLRVSSMDIELGLPISVQSAEVTDLDLTFEAGTVRALARVSDLYCQIAGHQVERARMLATLVEPHLSIQALEGQFEGGSLRSRGGQGSSSLSASLFSIDLVPPFPFQLSFEVDRVDVGQLLAGIFKSDFANEGRVKGAISLAGNIETLTDIHGSGYATLSDSALWSIPVFQDLFSQLGFETSATFKEMGSHFTVADGRIQMTNMRVKSDLLSLVGEGAFDLEGRLNYDLQVRYALVDRLGPFTRLLYTIQNSLLRISIRGDMSRPKVILKGILSSLMAKVGDGPPELPLPSYSALPDRF